MEPWASVAIQNVGSIWTTAHNVVHDAIEEQKVNVVRCIVCCLNIHKLSFANSNMKRGKAFTISLRKTGWIVLHKGLLEKKVKYVVEALCTLTFSRSRFFALAAIWCGVFFSKSVAFHIFLITSCLSAMWVRSTYELKYNRPAVTFSLVLSYTNLQDTWVLNLNCPEDSVEVPQPVFRQDICSSSQQELNRSRLGVANSRQEWRKVHSRLWIDTGSTVCEQIQY